MDWLDLFSKLLNRSKRIEDKTKNLKKTEPYWNLHKPFRLRIHLQTKGFWIQDLVDWKAKKEAKLQISLGKT
jgi:hypothetical protein